MGGAQVERRRRQCRGAAGAEGVGFGEGGVPSAMGEVSMGGIFFQFSASEWCILQFTRPVVKVKSLPKAQTSAPKQCLLYSTKKTTFSRFVSFIKVICGR